MALGSIKDGIALAEISLAKAEWLPSQEIFSTYVNILGLDHSMTANIWKDSTRCGEGHRKHNLGDWLSYDSL
jgi:hypothetical protein